MSNALAIAAVTSTLRSLLQRRFDADNAGGVVVTTRPLDKVQNNNGNGNQVNLFLYQTQINAAWRNMDMPGRTQPGETGYPPLALNLFYLLTTHAQDDDFPNPISHRLLGQAMSLLHDYTVLNPDDIRAALPAAELLEYDLQNQVERVRITPQPMSLEDLSKLWMIFQTQYRLSAAYEVSVVLIESNRPTKIPLPVLRRGAGDEGVTAQANLMSPYPTLTAIAFTAIEAARVKLPAAQASLLQKPAANWGDRLTLQGYNLDGNKVEVLFSHPLLPQPNRITIAPAQRTATQIDLTFNTDQLNTPPGFYTIAVEVTGSQTGQPDRILMTNGLPLALAPKLIPKLPAVKAITARRASPSRVVLTVTCIPQVFEGQRVALVLSLRETTLTVTNPQEATVKEVALRISDRELPAQPIFPNPSAPSPRKTGTFEVELLDIPAFTYTYHIRPRLRIDGVDSLVIDYSAIDAVLDRPDTAIALPLTFIEEELAIE